jgi:asparaginyl-tRNA synthetase
VLDERMAEGGIDREHYAWYRDLRRYGTVPHAGFGLAPAFAGGTLAYVTGLSNVRDAIPFPKPPATRSIDASSLAIASAFAAGGRSTPMEL